MSFVALAVLPQLLEAEDHVGHCKYILKSLLKFDKFARPNVTTSSKNNTLVIPTCPAHTGHMTENGRGHGRPPHRAPHDESLHSHVRARHTEQGPWPYTIDRNLT